MITPDMVVNQIVGYLNGELGLEQLVHWSEDALLSVSDSNKDVEREAVLIRILGYIGAGDTADFPLTWEVLNEFLAQLDTTVHVVVSSS